MVPLFVQIDLSFNDIGGYEDEDGVMIYAPEGPGAIANALRVSASLMSINLRANEIGSDGAKAIAEAIAVSASLTSIDLGYNSVGKEMALQLVEIFKEKQMVSVGLANCNLGVDGAQAVAEYISVSASLTQVLVLL